MRKKITKSAIAALKPSNKPFELCDPELRGFVLRMQPSGKATYYATYRLQDGLRNRVKLGSADVITATQARDAAKKVLADVTKGENPSKRRKEAKAHSLESYLDEVYSPWISQHRKTGAYQARRIRVAFEEFLGKKLGEISAWLIEKWRAGQLKKGVSAATCNRNVAALKAALNRAVEWEILETNPMAKVKLLKEDGGAKVRYLEPAEYARLMKVLDDREERIRKDRDSANRWRQERDYSEKPDLRAMPFADHIKPMVLLSLNTGMRQGEVFDLEWNDLDLNAPTPMLTVRGEVAKSSKTRYIPLNEVAATALRGWQTQADGKGLVFKSPQTSGRFDNCKKAWQQVMKDADIANFRWHDMRHDFASKLVMSGVDLNTVRELLGHSDIKMTLRYSHLAPQHKADAVAKLLDRANVVQLPAAKASRGRSS
jgi:integrase